MSLPVKISPAREHSIKESSISLFLSSPINRPERFRDLALAGGFFQLFKTVGETKLNVTLNLGKPSADETVKTDVGFKLEKFDNGEISFAVQGMNKLNKSFFSFHNLKYTRWNPFLDVFKSVSKDLLNIQKELAISAIGLNYVDEFIWHENEEIDLSRIMKENEYLPNNFIKIKRSGSLVNIRESDFGEDSIVDRLQIDANTKFFKGVRIMHNQTLLFKEITDFSENEGKILNNLNALHLNNKNFLAEVLKHEVQQLIKLV